jgi:hypothetical protein
LRHIGDIADGGQPTAADVAVVWEDLDDRDGKGTA